RRVSADVVYPALALLVLAPQFWKRMSVVLPDQQTAYLLAAAALLALLWLLESCDILLVPAGVVLAAAALTKSEGFLLGLLLALIVAMLAFAGRQRRRNGFALAAGPAAITPWFLWLHAHALRVHPRSACGAARRRRRHALACDRVCGIDGDVLDRLPGDPLVSRHVRRACRRDAAPRRGNGPAASARAPRRRRLSEPRRRLGEGAGRCEQLDPVPRRHLADAGDVVLASGRRQLRALRRLARLAHEVCEPGGRRGAEPPRALGLDAVDVRDASRREERLALAQGDAPARQMEGELALEHVEELVVVAVDVEGRHVAGAALDLHEVERSAGRRALEMDAADAEPKRLERLGYLR